MRPSSLLTTLALLTLTHGLVIQQRAGTDTAAGILDTVGGALGGKLTPAGAILETVASGLKAGKGGAGAAGAAGTAKAAGKTAA